MAAEGDAKRKQIRLVIIRAIAVMLAKYLLPYEKNKEKFLKNSRSRGGFKEALVEIVENPKVKWGMRRQEEDEDEDEDDDDDEDESTDEEKSPDEGSNKESEDEEVAKQSKQKESGTKEGKKKQTQRKRTAKSESPDQDVSDNDEPKNKKAKEKSEEQVTQPPEEERKKKVEEEKKKMKDEDKRKKRDEAERKKQVKLQKLEEEKAMLKEKKKKEKLEQGKAEKLAAEKATLQEKENEKCETWIETLHMLVKVSSRKRIGFHLQKTKPSWKDFVDSSMPSLICCGVMYSNTQKGSFKYHVTKKHQVRECSPATVSNHCSSLLYPAKFLHRESAPAYADVQVIRQLRRQATVLQRQGEAERPHTKENLEALNRWLS